MAGFTYVASQDANLSSIFGIVLLLNLIVYAVAFGLIIKGIKGMKG